ncbi:MAG: type II toxin-antitoxin system RelE/ParE family toxin [Gammaproteobacteria bacterium]|nr:type II toxin-antitoxin system RelE/ParE family toxin [Gammaproteobacteria bacterium]
MKLKLTPIARDDLEGIWEYIAEENPRAATHVAQTLMQKCRLLAESPCWDANVMNSRPAYAVSQS